MVTKSSLWERKLVISSCRSHKLLLVTINKQQQNVVAESETSNLVARFFTDALNMASEKWSRVQFQEGFMDGKILTQIYNILHSENTLYVETPLKMI